MEGEIGDLIIRPATPPALEYEEFTRSTFRPRALSTVVEREEHEMQVVTQHVSVKRHVSVSACNESERAAFLIYNDHYGCRHRTSLSALQEELLYEDPDYIRLALGAQTESVQHHDGAIDLRHGAVVHVYDGREALRVLPLTKYQVIAIWNARNHSADFAHLPRELGQFQCPRRTLEEIFGLRQATPYPGLNASNRPSFACGLPRLSVGPVAAKLLHRKKEAPTGGREARYSTIWANDRVTSYINGVENLTLADAASSLLIKPTPRLNARNLKAANRLSSSFLDLLKSALREDIDSVPEFHRSHNPMIVYGEPTTNSIVKPSKKQLFQRKVKRFFKRSVRVMDILRRKSRSAMNRVLIGRGSPPPVMSAKAEKIDAIVEWVMNQPHHTHHQEDGVVALTEDNLARLIQNLDEEYQVVRPEYLVPNNSRAGSVAGDDPEKKAEDDEDKEEIKNQTSDHHEEVPDKPKKDDDGDQGAGQGGQGGATQNEAAGNESSTDNTQNGAHQGTKEATKDDGADKSAHNEAAEEDLNALIRILRLAHERDPNEPNPLPDFLELMEAARKARLEEERFGPRVMKRTRPIRPIKSTQAIRAEKKDDNIVVHTTISITEPKDEKLTGQKVGIAVVAGADNTQLRQYTNEVTSRLPQFDIATTKRIITFGRGRFISASYHENHESALRCMADELRRGDREFAEETKIIDLRLFQPDFTGFYTAATNMGQSIMQLESNYSSWYTIPFIDPRINSIIVLGRGYEYERCDTPYSEDYDPEERIPFELIPDDDLPVLTHPPRTQPPAQALILHLLFKGHDIDDIAEELSHLDEDFLYKSHSRFWNRVRVPQLWQMNEPIVLEVLAIAQSAEKWWEKTTDPLGKDIPISLRVMQSRMRVNRVKQLARMSVENYLWWRFMGQRIHDIPTGFIIREFDN